MLRIRERNAVPCSQKHVFFHVAFALGSGEPNISVPTHELATNLLQEQSAGMPLRLVLLDRVEVCMQQRSPTLARRFGWLLQSAHVGDNCGVPTMRGAYASIALGACASIALGWSVQSGVLINCNMNASSISLSTKQANFDQTLAEGPC